MDEHGPDPIGVAGKVTTGDVLSLRVAGPGRPTGFSL
jgi:hypothetical protein